MCNIFSLKDIDAFLFRYSKEYENLIINIFQLVLIECIGCVIGEECIKKIFGSRSKIMNYIERETAEILSIILNGIRLKTLDKVFV